MKNILLIIALSLSFSSFGQYPENVSDKAFRLYQDGKFDSAIIFYNQLLNLKTDDKDDYYFNQLGECYFKLKDFENSKKYFLACLKVKDTVVNTFFNNNISKRESCFGLAEIYRLENNYEASLHILKLAEADFPYQKICSVGEFERKMSLNKKFAVCFEKLNMIDSAITYMTPYMFRRADKLEIDSPYYWNYVNYYYKLLCKKTSPKEIKDHFQKAIKEIYYKKQVDTTFSHNSESTWYNIESYFFFFGTKVYLCDTSYQSNGEEPVKRYLISTLMQNLRSTPAYKLINETKSNKG